MCDKCGGTRRVPAPKGYILPKGEACLNEADVDTMPCPDCADDGGGEMLATITDKGRVEVLKRRNAELTRALEGERAKWGELYRKVDDAVRMCRDDGLEWVLKEMSTLDRLDGGTCDEGEGSDDDE